MLPVVNPGIQARVPALQSRSAMLSVCLFIYLFIVIFSLSLSIPPSLSSPFLLVFPMLVQHSTNTHMVVLPSAIRFSLFSMIYSYSYANGAMPGADQNLCLANSANCIFVPGRNCTDTSVFVPGTSLNPSSVLPDFTVPVSFKARTRFALAHAERNQGHERGIMIRG